MREKDKQRRNDYPASHCRKQGYPLRCPHPLQTPQPKVIADDGLCRLRNGIPHHEHERHIITSDAERPHPVITQVLHEHVVAHEHQHRHRSFRQQGG